MTTRPGVGNEPLRKETTGVAATHSLPVEPAMCLCQLDVFGDPPTWCSGCPVGFLSIPRTKGYPQRGRATHVC